MKFHKVYLDKVRLFFRFLELSYLEIKNITWQKSSETFRFTLVIIVVVLFVSFFLWLFDLFFVKFLGWLIF